ncbi:unnamed protein product [Paramecium sonneborni]|uniref:U3 small nucleolar RNA-associated protein 20 domain-containing protein n=2 Tax=Paramecium sonneborni TaxID=65129 RepID=A0A8S1K9I4_9CILI|nr:unnamed protein product [Paramecium sonneborni]
MVKYIPTKRQSKKETLQEPKQAARVIRHYHLEEKVDKRHRFKTTKQQREEIDINLQRRIEDIHIETKSDISGCYFRDIIELKRSTLSTLMEKKFMNESYNYAQSLPQILVNLRQLLDIAYIYLKEKSSKNLVLDTLPYLIKDTREEFYPYLEKTIREILSQIDIEQVEHLEKSFLFIAYAIKYLEKVLIDQFEPFINLMQEVCFSSKFNIIKKLASESVGYLFRKNRSLIHRALNIVNPKQLSYSIFISIQSIKGYLAQNTFKVIDEIWKTQNNDLIQQFYIVLIQNATEVSHQSPKIMISLLEVFKDLKLRTQSLDQAILIELFKNNRKKATPQIINEVITFVNNPESIGYLLRLHNLQIEEIIISNKLFVNKMLNQITIEEFSNIVEIILQQPIHQSSNIYKLLIASTFQQLFQQKEEALILLLKLDEIHCIDKLTPDQLDKLYTSELFSKLLCTDNNFYVLSLCKLIQMVEFPTEIKQQIINKLQATLHILNNNIQSNEQKIDYTLIINNIEKLSSIKLEISEEVELLYAEQNQDNKSLEDGIIIKILQNPEIKQLELNRTIYNLFSRLNLQTKEFFTLLTNIPKNLLEIGLMSRKRQIRLICAQKLFELENSEQLQLMIDIDSEKINIDNERRIKNSIINLKNLLNKSINVKQIERYAFGLAFTKFFLVRQTIRELLTSVLSKCDIQSILRIFLITPQEYQKCSLSYLDKHCYLEQDEEQLESQICFDEVFAQAIQHCELNQNIKQTIFQISTKYLQQQYEEDINCIKVEQYYKRRYGDKTSQFHLKMLYQSSQIQLFKHWLLKDDEQTQMIALNNIKFIEIQNNLQEYHGIINEFFSSMEQMINGNTFKGEIIRFQLDLPQHLQEQFKLYILNVLYPKIFSKQKLHKKKHKNSAIQVRRNAVFEQLSNLNLQNELINLIQENHGFHNDLNEVPIQIKIQYLKILKNLIEKFGYQINVQQLEKQIKIIRQLLNHAFLLKQNENVTSLSKELWKVGIKRLCQIVNKYHSEQSFTEMIQENLKFCFEDNGFIQGFEKIVIDSKSQPSGILKLLQSVCLIKDYQQFICENHELLLSRFFQLYDFTYIKQIHLNQDEDGRLAHQLKHQISQKISAQRNCIQILNSILYSIYQLSEPSTTIEIEPNQLCCLFTQQYGEQLLNCLLNNVNSNIECESEQIKDLNMIYLIYTILMNRKEFNNAILNQCLILFSKQIKNPKLYDSQIHNHNLMGKLLNNCIKCILDKDIIVEYDLVVELFQSYSQLLILVKNLTTRNLIVDVIISMAIKFKVQYPLNENDVQLLKAMNQRNHVTEEIEYEKCLEACLQFQKIIHNDKKTTELILQNCFYLLTSQELSIRISVLEIFKSYLSKNIKSEYIKQNYLPQMIQLMKMNEETSVKAALQLFEHYLLCIQIDEYTQQILNNQPLNMIEEQYDSGYCEFKVLFENENPDQNVFNLIFDIQLIKRIKGAQLIQKRLMQIPVLLIESVSKIMLPLLDFYIFYAGGELNNHKHKLTDANKSHYLTLQDVSIQMYGYICSHFDFERRISLMQQLTKKLEKSMISNKQQLSNALIKTISIIASNKDDNFNVIKLIKERLQMNSESKLQDYLQQYISIEEEQQNTQIIDFEFSYRSLIQQEKELAKVREIKDVSNQFWNQIIDITVDEIQEWQDRSNILLKQIYLPLKNLFLLDEKHRVQLSISLTELIIQLPPENFMIELNKLVGKLCRLLKSKDNDVRDETRKCLLDLSRKIGPIFLKFIIIQMKSILIQGFENHVLSYTLGLLLEQITEIGQIDNCLEEIMEILLDEVFGRLCTEKDTETLPKKTKEIKSKKGMQNFKIVGSLINFVNSLPKLIGTIDYYITQYQISHNLHSKLKLIFEHLYLGLINNQSVQNIVQVIYLMICETSYKLADSLKQTHNLDFTYGQGTYKKITKEDIMSIQLPSYGSQSISTYIKQNKLKTSSTIIYGLVNFISIKLLHHNIHNIEDSPLLQKMFSIILECLNHKDMITECVSVISAMIKRFDWVLQFKKQIIQNAMQCLSTITSTDEQFIRDSFLLLKAILDSKLNEFTLQQQKTLVHFIDLYLESNESLECLKLIIHAIWPLPQIYDIILKVRESMLQTTKKTQNLCQQIYINFLIKYPLSSQVLQQHYDFIIANLQYKYFGGRMIILQCLQQIFLYFPLDTVNKLSEISYFSLIVALVKEDVDTLKEQLINVLNTLISKTTQDKIMKFTQNSLIWMTNDKLKVQLSGLESLFILKDHLKYYQSKFILSSNELIDKCITNWNEWKNTIQAKNIQNKNLKNSQWANELEAISVSEYPELQQSLHSLLKLLNVIDENQLILIYEQNTICKLFKCVQYPHQETANQAIQLLIRSKHLNIIHTQIQIQQDHIVKNMQKITKYLFLIKFARNQIIINQELTFKFILDYLNLLQEQEQEQIINLVFECLLKVTTNLMAKQLQLNKGIENLMEFYQYIISNGFMSNKMIIESILRIQSLQQEMPIIDQILKLIEKQVGAQEFISKYSSIQQELNKVKVEKKIQNKMLAIKDPQKFQEKRQRKMKTKLMQKKNKLLMKRGKIIKE